MAVDPRLLRTFATVARLASFSAAARELGYTQSAVSQHVATLEADVGATLLDRRPVAPTEAGTRLLEHAGPILLRLEAARADVARVVAEPPGTLRVGATPLATGAAAGAIAAARRQNPALAASLRLDTPDAIAMCVARGELEAGLVDGIVAPGDPLPLPETGVPVVAFVEAPLALALAPGHPLLAVTHGPALEDLADARWIEAPAVTGTLDALAMLARAAGFRPALRYDGQDVGGLLALVASGQGLAVLPARVVRDGVPLDGPRLVHRTELIAVEAPAALAGALVS